MSLTLYPSRLTEEHINHAYPDFWDAQMKEIARLWLKDMQSGARPLTIRSIQTFRERFIRYTCYLNQAVGFETLTLQDCLEIKTVYSAISHFPVESYSNRHNTFYAVYSLAKFLVQLELLEEDYLRKLKRFRPKRIIAPKRTSIRDAEMLAKLIGCITDEHFKSKWGCLVMRTIVETLAQTGLRNTELCQLTLEDVNLANQTLKVKLGKGRKDRQVGICKGLLPHLETYLAQRHRCQSLSKIFFLNSYLNPFTTASLGNLIKKLSTISGIPITTHGLRRTFATLHAEQGKPIHLIQLALGHNDIRTTQEYLMSDQETVIEAMKDW